MQISQISPEMILGHRIVRKSSRIARDAFPTPSIWLKLTLCRWTQYSFEHSLTWGMHTAKTSAYRGYPFWNETSPTVKPWPELIHRMIGNVQHAQAPTTMERRASILIVKYKAEPKCLPYLSGNIEILIRDNTSDNIGFARAVNQLLSDATGENIILLNPDTIPLGNWLDQLIARAESDPRIGIVQPKLVQPNGLLDSTGHEPERFLYHDRGQNERDNGQYDQLTEIPSATFACVLIKRKVFDTVGMLDPKMLLYFEDVDFSLRARRAGWRIVYEPRATVIHDRGHHHIPSANVNMLRIYVKNRMWRRILWWHINTALGVIAGAKNRDPQYSRDKLGNLLHFQRLTTDGLASRGKTSNRL